MRIKSIGTVLILAACATVAAGVLAIILYVTASTYNLALAKEQQSLRQSTSSTQRALALFAQDSASVIRALAMQESMHSALNGDPAKTQKRLAETIKANPNIWSLLVFDTSGMVRSGVNANGGDLTGQSRADRDYVKAILGGADSYLGKTIIQAKTGGGDMPIYIAVQSLRDASGAVVGGVGAFLRWEAFVDQFVSPLRFGERGYGFMLDPAGKVVAHAADKAMMLKDVSSFPFVKDALAAKNGEFFYDWKGEQKYMAFATDPGSGFLVCMSVYADDLTATARSQRNMLIGIGAAVLALVGLAITLLTRRLVVAPIQEIETYTRKVAQADYSATLSSGLRYEFASLSGNIRAMVEELKNKLGFSQGVLQSFVLPCAVFDKQNKTEFVNGHMLEALGKPGEARSYLGQTSGQLVWGDPGRETVSSLALKENRMIRNELEYPTSAGTRIFDVTSTPIRDLDGGLLGTLAVWFDLTDIRTQQRKIEEQNARIASAAAQATLVSDQVASASEELAAQIDQSSQGTGVQRERTTETATAMEQMNATVMEVASSAGSAADLADQAKGQAQHGATLVDQVVTTISQVSTQAEALRTDMAELGKQADGIGEIMTVIADIADQTNLLALNAAIEAARAGDAGRGFAVVADEVRKLAEKTMTATNEVGKHIASVQESARRNVRSTDATTEAIAASTRTARDSGEALRAIVATVDRTADQVRGIATASEEQSAASEQISRSTEEINRIAATTAEAMQQSRAAVSDLARLAGDLKRIIGEMSAA